MKRATIGLAILAATAGFAGQIGMFPINPFGRDRYQPMTDADKVAIARAEDRRQRKQARNLRNAAGFRYKPAPQVTLPIKSFSGPFISSQELKTEA